MKSAYNLLQKSRNRKSSPSKKKDEPKVVQEPKSKSHRSRAEAVTKSSTAQPEKKTAPQGDNLSSIQRLTKRIQMETRAEALREQHSYGMAQDNSYTQSREDAPANDPTCLAEAIKMQSQDPPSHAGFLPIAMPRPDPPEELHFEPDFDYEYESVFDAPEHIDVTLHTYSGDDAITEVSDLTHITDLTSGLHSYGSSNLRSNSADKLARGQMRDFKHQRRIANLRRATSNPSAGRLEIVSEEKQNAEYVEPQPTPQRKEPEIIDVERRRGLPYEETDFKPDDEDSKDTWDDVIVGSHIIKAAEKVISNKQDPGDGEEISRNVQGPPTPRARDEKPQRRTPREPRTPEKLSRLAKETLSAQGEVIIDISAIEDREFDKVNKRSDKKKSNRQREVTKVVELRNAVQETREAEPTAVDAPAAEEPSSELKSSSDPTPTTPAPPQQTSDNQTKSVTDDYISYATSYLQSVADGMKNQLEKIQTIELIPEDNISGMLGVLGQGITETSKSVPEQRDEMVLFLGEQIEKTTCGIDRSEATIKNDVSMATSMEELMKSVKAIPVDNLVNNVKKTYRANLVDCGINGDFQTSNGMKKQDPQTYIVPMDIHSSALTTESILTEVAERKCE